MDSWARYRTLKRSANLQRNVNYGRGCVRAWSSRKFRHPGSFHGSNLTAHTHAIPVPCFKYSDPTPRHHRQECPVPWMLRAPGGYLGGKESLVLFFQRFQEPFDGWLDGGIQAPGLGLLFAPPGRQPPHPLVERLGVFFVGLRTDERLKPPRTHPAELPVDRRIGHGRQSAPGVCHVR